ncbi:MAG: site-specific integrase [Ignavibacteria bacterium]|nr:site-specific integrase [Ignavibacteria bacterium]
MYLSKRKNGVYYVFYNQPNGKRTCISTGERIKTEALKFLSNFEGELKEREKNKTIPISLKDFRFEFLKYSESIHSQNTSKVFKVTFNYLKEYFGNPQLSEITSKRLNEYFTMRMKKSVYPARKDLINISSAFTYAVKQGYLLENPCQSFKRFKIPEKQPLFFSELQFELLLKVIDEKDIRDLVEFAVQTGLRQMELITLEWSQINFKDRILILDNRNNLTKSKKIRTVPLSLRAMQILSERELTKKNEAVFTLYGQRITQKFISKRFKQYVIESGINPKLNFHSLRHTFASWLVQRGVSIYEVSKLLGHSNISVTEIYSHLRAEDLRTAINALNN